MMSKVDGLKFIKENGYDTALMQDSGDYYNVEYNMCLFKLSM